MYVLEFAGEDDSFAAAEAKNATSGATVVAPGLGITDSINEQRFRGLAYTRRASRVIGHTDANVTQVQSVLAGIEFDRAGSVAVRARDIRRTTGVDTQQAERVLGEILSETGFTIDLDNPDHEFRVLFSGEVCYMGWLVSETTRDYGDRIPTAKPYFQPGSMDPLDARAVVNLAGAAPGTRLLDPMCGTGGILIEAGLLGAVTVGIDVQEKMTRGTRQNLAEYPMITSEVIRGDATRLPVRDSIDSLVVDFPYGRQSKVTHTDQETLIRGTLLEAQRITSHAVIVSDQSWVTVIEAAGWSVEAVFERRVHRSLTRFIHVLETGT